MMMPKCIVVYAFTGKNAIETNIAYALPTQPVKVTGTSYLESKLRKRAQSFVV